MMNLGKVWLLLAFMGFLAGCQPVDSFSPLYTDKDVSFDPALLGKWVQEDGTLEFSESNSGSYAVVFSDNSSPQRMVLEGHLVVLQGRRFLDVIQKNWMARPDSFPLDIEQAKNGLKFASAFIWAGDGSYLEFVPGNTVGKTTQVSVQLRVAHWFFRLANDDKNLKLDFVDDDRLSQTLQQKTVQLPHVLVGPVEKDDKSDYRHLALTATTTELQKFVLEHVNDDQVFTDSLKLHRPDKPAAQGQ